MFVSNSSAPTALEMRPSSHHLALTTHIDDRLAEQLVCRAVVGVGEGAPREGRAPSAFIGIA